MLCFHYYDSSLRPVAENFLNTSAFSVPFSLQALHSGETNQSKIQFSFRLLQKDLPCRNPLKYSNPYLLLSSICVFLLCSFLFFFCSELSWLCQDSVFYWVVRLVLNWSPPIDVVWNGWREHVAQISELKCQILITRPAIVIESSLYQRERERGRKRWRSSWEEEKQSEHYLMLLSL